MQNSTDNHKSQKDVRPKEILNLIIAVIIIVLVYFSINNRHKENQNVFEKNNEICHELSLVSRSIAKAHKDGFENILPDNISSQTLQADKYIRDLFAKKIAYQKLFDEYEYPYFQDKAGYGMLLPNKTVIWFKHLSENCTEKEPCVILFIDVNNTEKPNKDNYDRTVRKIYKDGLRCGF